MNRISRGTPAGDAYLDLKSQAQRSGRTTQELLQLYVLEGFLARLAVSDVRDNFVLKGGVLLAAFDNRRPTKDVDLAGLGLANDTATVLAHVRRVLDTALPEGDGIDFLTETVAAKVIREDDDYSGVRVSVAARLASANLPFHVDVNVGDPIWPKPSVVSIPRLRGGDPIELAGYPIHMVHAEKLVTAIQRGTANTRWRDFGDVWSLSRRHPVAADELRHAIEEVARHRNARLAPLAEVLGGYADLAQDRWAAWRRRSGSENLPGQFSDVLRAVIEFADPVLTGKTEGLAWAPGDGARIEEAAGPAQPLPADRHPRSPSTASSPSWSSTG